MDPSDRLFYVYLGVLSIILLFTLSPGLRVTDEGTYLLMVDSLAEDRQLHIWNGFDELQSREFYMPSTQLVSDGTRVRMYGIPAPLYAFIAAPFYLAFGVVGLNLLNTLSYILLLFVLYRMACLLFDKHLGLYSTVLFSLTYAFGYSQMLWPQILSILLVTVSTHLIYRQYLKGGSKTQMFLAGLLSALAFGVRYTNGLFAFIHLLFLWFLLRDHLKPFMTGLLIPVSAIAYINFISFGSILETSYGSFTPYLALMAASGYALTRIIPYFADKGFSTRKIGIKHVFLSLVAVILLFTFLEPARTYLSYFYFKVFDMDAAPGRFFLQKKALLESVPYLVLAAFAPAILYRRNFDRKILISLAAYAAVEVLFYSTRVMHGGVDESYGMRYFIESLPFIVILSVVSMKELIRGLGRKNQTPYGVIFPVFAFHMLSSGDRLYAKEGFYAILPQLLFISLTVSALYTLSTQKARSLTVLFIVLSCSYSVSIGLADFKLMKTYRDGVWGSSMNVLDQVQDDSVIVYYVKGEYPYLAAVKALKKVRLAAAVVDDAAQLHYILHYYSAKEKPIYLDKREGGELYKATVEYVVENNITGVYYISYE